MSLLTPLYIAGLVALGLPVLLHLIRRMPRNRRRFSSLMFLAPSPPRVTRRSRIENPLLLCLRLLALALLAFAFARPFLRHEAESEAGEGTGRRVAVLVDRSASMRRADLWPQALAKVDAVLDGLAPPDDAALLAFSDRVERLVPFSRGAEDPDRHRARIRSAMAAMAPAWGATDPGAALAAAAETINEGYDAPGAGGVIVLVSDCGIGGSLDALEGFAWPADVALRVERVAPDDASNAGVSLAAAGSIDDAAELRVRVTNDRESEVQDFELGWATRAGPLAGATPASVHVPPGESRVVRLARLPEGAADRVVLTGDGHVFDNTLYVAPLVRERVSIIYIGADDASDPDGLLYYLTRGFPATAQRAIEISRLAPGDALNEDAVRAARLVVLSAPLEPEKVRQLETYVLSGGTILCILTDAALGECARVLLGAGSLHATEADAASYALLGAIDFAHPLFAPFNDPRYNDFAKIRFWRHRRVAIEAPPAARVVARFDDGDPALIERERKDGRVLVLAGSWRPADSQLARSTKFVPLLAGILELSDAGQGVRPAYVVGETVTLGAGALARETVVIGRPDGAETPVEAGARVYTATDEPGMYALRRGDARRAFGVNVPPAETKTAPFGVEEFERRGVHLHRREAPVETAARRRQLADTELEGSQKLWQWLLAAVLGVLCVETVLAGHAARKRTPEASP